MPAIFSKNCILTGELDAYCLVCSDHLTKEEEVLVHIQDSKHKAKLSKIGYFEKHEGDFIRKLDGLYFCEVCNATFPTATKVGIHVADEAHVKGKGGRSLSRVGKLVTLGESTLIDEDAWHGLVEDTCVVCNVDFDDYSRHKGQKSHILNLIKSTVTIVGTNLYRKVDGMCQCLTCNKVLPENLIENHFESSEHNNTDDVKGKDSDTGDKMESLTNGGDSDKTVKTDGFKDIQSPKTGGTSLYTRPVLMTDKEKPASSQCIPKDLETFSKKHGLCIKKDHVYCNTCKSRVPLTLMQAKLHVTETKHIENLSKQTDAKKQIQKVKIEKMPSKDFIQEVSVIETVLGHFMLINDTFYLNVGHILGFAMHRNKIICQFCNIDLPPSNLDTHKMTSQHKSLVENCYVITSLDGEFVRQVKEDLYHCGFCGRVEDDWDDMLAHLASIDHKQRRAACEESLRDVKMQIFYHNLRNSVESNMFNLLSRMREFNRPFY